MTIGERIKKLREEQSVSQTDLATAIKISKQNLYKYENDIITNIPSDRIELIAQYFNTTPAYLMGWEDKIQNIADIDNIIPLERVRYVPVLGTIACGQPIWTEENFSGRLLLPDDVNNADFALRCQGDSMIGAGIHNDDVVYIKKQPTVENGEIGVVVIGNEATLKKVYLQNDTLTLMPANTEFTPIVYIKDEINSVTILGKAVGVLHKI